jgi:hypothetical protein
MPWRVAGSRRSEEDTARRWSEFWSRGAVYLHSASGQADFIEQNYDYFLYLFTENK